MNHLADNIVYFARALRAAGMPVGPGAVLDALQAVALFFRKRASFDKLILPPPLTQEEAPPKPGAQRVQEALFAALRPLERDKTEVERDARFTVSDREILQAKDFAQMTAAEIAA